MATESYKSHKNHTTPPTKRFKREVKRRAKKQKGIIYREEILRRYLYWAREQKVKAFGKFNYWLTCRCNLTNTDKRTEKIDFKLHEAKSVMIYWGAEVSRINDLLNYNPETVKYEKKG